jgi:hypothetical protein
MFRCLSGGADHRSTDVIAVNGKPFPVSLPRLLQRATPADSMDELGTVRLNNVSLTACRDQHTGRVPNSVEALSFKRSNRRTLPRPCCVATLKDPKTRERRRSCAGTRMLVGVRGMIKEEALNGDLILRPWHRRPSAGL